MSFSEMLVSVIRNQLGVSKMFTARYPISLQDHNPHKIVFPDWKSSTGLRVESYGTGTQVRLPGRTAMGK